MDPINYNVDVKSPFEASMSGLTQGFNLRKEITQAQQQEQAVKLQQQLQTDLAGLANKPNAGASDFANVMIKYPQLSEHFKRGWDTLNGEQQQNKLSSATQVYAAVNSGRPDIAQQLLTDQAAALRNSGKEQEAKAAETMAKFIEMDPKSAKTTTGLLLSSLMGPEKFAETFTKLEKENRDAAGAPAELTKKEADARAAIADANLKEIKAKYGEQSEITSLAEKGWNIKKIEQDIIASKAGVSQGAERNRIAAMTAALGRESNGLKREELQLKINETKIKQADDVRGKVAEITNARASIDNMLNTADQLLKHPGKEAALGSIAAKIPTLRQDTADFEALVENLDAQSFIAQVPAMKGMGALSDAEGKRLSNALQSFSLKQSPTQFSDNVREAQRLMLKARKTMSDKYGVPNTVPDTPAAAPSDKDVGDLLKKYGPKGASGTY
jgi:uncharacterized membrane-anchored protein YhcB (DUF1043 family)